MPKAHIPSVLISLLFISPIYDCSFRIIAKSLERNAYMHGGVSLCLGIYIYICVYHFHTSDQRKASAYISHIALTQNVNEIYALCISR